MGRSALSAPAAPRDADLEPPDNPEATVRTPRVAPAALVTLLALGLLAACGDDDEEASTDATTTTATTVEAAEAIAISGAWARTTPAGTDRSAIYLTITAPADDALVAASVDPSVAGRVELHETVEAEGDMPGSTMTVAGGGMGDADMGGQMTMQPVERIELPAGEAVALAPGGLHIMVLDLPEPLVAGATVEVTLTFEVAAPVTLAVTVSDEAP
jgi:copper(I)-binding protein